MFNSDFDDDCGCGCAIILIVLIVLAVVVFVPKEAPTTQIIPQPVQAEQELTPEPIQNSPQIPKEAQLFFVDNKYQRTLSNNLLMFYQTRYYQYPENNKLTIYKEEMYRNNAQNEFITNEIHVYEFPNAQYSTIQYLGIITDKSEE